MINRITVQNNKLYETINGQRFRVTWDSKLKRFVCPRSSYIRWDTDGWPSSGCSGDILAREVPELRWVSIKAEDIKDGDVVKTKRGHWFVQVTRQHAQRAAPNYNKPVLQKPATSATLGDGVTATLIQQNGKRFVRIVTGNGREVLVEA